MPTIDLADTTIHYEEAGEGPPLLMLHGGLGTAMLHFRREIPRFAERYRVIAPDMRGYGRSSPPREFPLDFYERDAADMAQLLEAVVGGPAHVLGWSDGAIVALRLAGSRPELARSLVAIAGEATILEEERANWPPLADPATWSPSAVERFREVQGEANWPGIFEKMLAGYNALLDELGGEVVSRALLGEIRCPVLLVHGYDDPVVPAKQVEQLTDVIRFAEVRVFGGAGHLPHRDRADDFFEVALDFLASAEQRFQDPSAFKPLGAQPLPFEMD